MKDILAEPGELRKILDYTWGPGRRELERAAELVRAARHVYIAGMGSSWHAGMAVQSLFARAGRPVMLVEAADFVHFTEVAPESAAIVLSRSGRSVEIVQLVEKLKRAGARIVAVTNAPDSTLARFADVTLRLQARFDHLVSVTMYSGVALMAGLLAASVTTQVDDALIRALDASYAGVEAMLETWRADAAESGWFAAGEPVYFLARGASIGSCHEARLCWEEAAKTPATALPTGDFRHGPQEMLRPGARIGLWLDAERVREADLQLAEDLRRAGAEVFLIGQRVLKDAASLVAELPEILAPWQFLIDIIPAQIAAEQMSHVAGVNCDSFRLCPYVVETEGGL